MKTATNSLISRNRRLRPVLYLPLLVLLLWPTLAHAQDKSGVKPQVISLPSGPGSLEGLGENFEPDLSSGTATYPVKFTAAPGRANFQPELALNYNGGNANGPWGMGWKLSSPAIQRRTEDGLPNYVDSQDQFIFSNGEKLVALTDGTYRFENESSFMRFQRLAGGGWAAQSPDGLRYHFGEDGESQVTNAKGIFRWELSRVIDTHGNELRYHYLHDGGYAYPREIRYNFGTNGSDNAVIFNYAPRPDTYTDRRSGAPIRVGLRGTDIQMWAQGKLVRAYQFTYEPEGSTGIYSLLIGVTQVGDDGTSTLPPHTFTYTQFDPAAHGVVTMQNPPPVALTNRDADLVDINADGLPDLVYTPENGQHRFYLNRGQGRWATEPIIPENSPAERLSNPNVRMADMNGDGRVDLLVKASGTGAPLYYYRNQPGADWEKDDRVDFGPAPAFDLNDPNLQLLDINNDHRIDVVLTAGGRLKIWLAREQAWSQTADFDVPAPLGNNATGFADPKIKVGDMTGDRMEDLIFVRDGQVVLWAHNGNGDYAEGQPILNPPRDVGAADVAIQMGDLNNDGQVDLVLPGNRTVTYWLSLGDGSLAAPIVIPNTPAFNAQDSAVRLADVDGDGATELLFSSQAGMSYVDFATTPQPFLLRSVDNGLGRTIQITYKSSIADYIMDWDNNQPWAINLPFPVQVVNQVTVHDANSGDDYTIDYHYRDGFYDGLQKEFRGFVRSEEIKRGDASAATTVTRLHYDVGMTAESQKGMLLEKEVLAEGGRCADTFAGCYQRQINQLTTQVVVEASQTQTGKAIAYAYTSQSDTFVHEQQAEPVQLRQRFAQDRYGNVTQSFNYGQVCGADLSCGDDEVLTYHEWIYNTEDWLLNRPQRSYQTDAGGNFVSESRFYYDGEPFVGLPLGQLTRGDLVREEKNLGPQGEHRYIATQRYQLDSYGNRIVMMDANGNRTTVDYDPVAHTFPVVEQRHFADGRTLTYAASYHPGFGQATSATDYNGQPHIFTFDTFGRLAKMVKPGDTLAQPTEEYSYQIGSPRSAVLTKKRIQSGADAVITSITYTDGLGRKLQTRTATGDGQVVVAEAVTFNARQGVAAQYLPYFSTGDAYTPPEPTLPQIKLYYDPLGRVIRTVHPDGAFVSVIHKPLVQELYDEEDNRQNESAPHANTPQIMHYDGLERLTSVEEINLVNGQPARYLTRYRYDRLGNLIQLIDAQNNSKTMVYDALSRRLRMVDPNRGEMFYSYDDNGNLIKTVDAKGQAVHYTYDAANRLLNERWTFNNGRPDLINAIYHYDSDLSPLHPDARNTLGQIAYVEDQAGALYFSYDGRGNVTDSIRYYKDEKLSFVNRKAYDALDRLSRTIYADGTAVSYEYDSRGLLTRIPGFVEQISYTAAGQRERITYANGAQSTYRYDQRQRLAGLQTVAGPTTLQDFTYTLDAVGNVLRIADARAGKTAANDQSQDFGYDSLYRLLSASGAYGQIDFGYDAIGNLVQKTSSGPAGAPADQRLNLGELRYGENGAGPHAVTTAGGLAYRYDANGNLAGKGDTTYQWNPRDLLVAANDGTSSSTYQYDAGSQRVKQRVQAGTVITTTLYPDGSSELRGNELIFYVFDDERRMAELRKPFDAGQLLQGFSDQVTTVPSAGTKRWYIGDHLGSTHLILDDTAAVIAEKVYYPFGLSRFAQNGGATPYGYTGKELDASGLHYYEARYYDALVGRFISVDPLYLDKPQAGAQNPQLLNLYAYGLNNPLKYVDPNGASPVQQLKIPLSNGFQHPRQYLVFEMEIQDYSAYGAGSFQQGVHVQAKMAVVTQRGDKWTVVGQPQPVMLKFTALPNSKVQSLAGTQFKDVIKPQTVKSTGMCVGNMCVMAYTASGGRVRNMETQAMMGKFSLLSPDGKSAVPLDKFNAEACTVADAFFFKHETGYREQLPTQYGIGAGVGVTDGKDPEASSHIIGGPTTGSLQIDSSNLKVKDSPH